MIKSNPHDQIMFRNDITEISDDTAINAKTQRTLRSVPPKDLKFYRKRVFDHVHLLHKHLFTGEPVKAVPPKVADAYTVFVKEMMDYLKTRDEIEFYSKQNDNKDVKCTETPIQKVDIHDINRQMMLHLPKHVNDQPENNCMNKYVKIKQNRKSTSKFSYPKQMNFNPYDLKLKNKRIIQNGKSEE